LAKKIYVGNIAFTVTESQVREMFEEYGAVDSVAWITDRDTGRFRGFAFVEMEDAAANSAINGLNGKDIDGRPLKVDEAKPRAPR
jgi:RNA recognition motif-containing protein